MNQRIQAANGEGALIRDTGIGRLSIPKGVVDRDEAAGADQLEAAFVIGDDVCLIGIDEGEVVAIRFAGGEPCSQSPPV